MTGNHKSTSLKDTVALLQKEIAELKEARATPEPLLAEKGQFFGMILAQALGTQGSRAFSDRYLETLENNAERFWHAYLAIVKGDKIKLAQERIEAIQAEKQALQDKMDRLRSTIEAQAATIRDLSTMDEDDTAEEATEDAAQEAATEVAAN